MSNQINKTTTVFAVFILLLLMFATRGHSNWLSTLIHLPDFTLPALFIAGIYLRQFWVAFVLIFSAVAIDNYAIVHQGLSANCITPAYSILPLTYYGVFWASKYLNTLSLDSHLIKNVSIITAISSIQWLSATVSYYVFTAAPWSKFGTYVVKWSILEIPPVLYWLIAVMAVFTLAARIIPILSTKSNVR